jgi:tRNA pseudouridine38/39 synthase
LSYLGKRYNGFEYHSGHATPLPTIEEELWKALNKARLIFPAGADGKGVNPIAPGEINWEGCEYSKCGRTDKGVSAFGQVIGIRVRSNRPLKKKTQVDIAEGGEGEISNASPEISARHFNTLPREGGFETVSPPLSPSRAKLRTPEPSEIEPLNLESEDEPNFDSVSDELPYCSLLNRLLPPDIRILAWCPAPPSDFSARFSCRERQYRYFFTQPAFAPVPHHLELSEPGTKVKDGWLDIQAMREAAKLFEGEHDFRNFCKVDGGKQISNFERRIFKADIEEVEDQTSSLAFVNSEGLIPPGIQSQTCPKIYTFTLHGSAFLWHQVRCMVSILFLVAQGLEKPSIVSELLDVQRNPGRPTYEMATDTPLVLWDCVFPHEDDPTRKDAMQWVYVGEGIGLGDTKYGTASLMENLWQVWRERKIDEMLAGTLINVVAKQGGAASELSLGREKKASRSQRVFDGGDVPRLQGTYIPVMRKPKMDSVDVINEKYAIRKGFESGEDMKTQGFRRLNKPAESVVPKIMNPADS